MCLWFLNKWNNTTNNINWFDFILYEFGVVPLSYILLQWALDVLIVFFIQLKIQGQKTCWHTPKQFICTRQKFRHSTCLYARFSQVELKDFRLFLWQVSLFLLVLYNFAPLTWCSISIGCPIVQACCGLWYLWFVWLKCSGMCNGWRVWLCTPCKN